MRQLRTMTFLLLLASVTAGAQAQHRIIHNNDGTDVLGNRWFHQRPLTVADVEAAVDMVAGSQVTTYMMCTGSAVLEVPSKYTNMLGEDWAGRPVPEKLRETFDFYRTQYYGNHLRLAAEGTDLVKASLSRARQRGLETFITYRMNDLHFVDTLNCPMNAVDRFWFENPDKWVNDPSIGYNSAGALDFSHAEVRQQKLNIISEQLERYASYIDGYDLDFMRFIVYFKSGEGRRNAPLMTQLLKDIRAKVDAVSDSVGHRILLTARVAPTVDECMEKGLDVREWLRLGLLDFISIGTHWRGDPAMPVGKFREDLGPDLNIPLYASIDDGGFKPRETWSHGAFRGMASSILGQGADGLYLFNFYFGQLMSELDGQLKIEDGGQVCRVAEPSLLQELGSLETLRRRNKVYALSDGHDQYRIVPNTPFPLTVGARRTASARIFVGDDTRRDRPEQVLLFVRARGGCDVRFNGRRLSPGDPAAARLYDKDRELGKDEGVLVFKVRPQDCRQGYNGLQFSPRGGECTVIRAELLVGYGNVEECGYF